jgi:hypothetical protein
MLDFQVSSQVCGSKQPTLLFTADSKRQAHSLNVFT